MYLANAAVGVAVVIEVVVRIATRADRDDGWKMHGDGTRECWHMHFVDIEMKLRSCCTVGELKI